MSAIYFVGVFACVVARGHVCERRVRYVPLCVGLNFHVGLNSSLMAAFLPTSLLHYGPVVGRGLLVVNLQVQLSAWFHLM